MAEGRKETKVRESRVGVGVIGVGGISSYVHLPGLRLCPQAEIVAVCDADGDLARQRAAEYDVPHVLTDYQDLLGLPAVDAVVVATPTVLHAPIALAAIVLRRHALPGGGRRGAAVCSRAVLGRRRRRPSRHHAAGVQRQEGVGWRRARPPRGVAVSGPPHAQLLAFSITLD